MRSEECRERTRERSGGEVSAAYAAAPAPNTGDGGASEAAMAGAAAAAAPPPAGRLGRDGGASVGMAPTLLLVFPSETDAPGGGAGGDTGAAAAAADATFFADSVAPVDFVVAGVPFGEEAFGKPRKLPALAEAEPRGVSAGLPTRPPRSVADAAATAPGGTHGAPIEAASARWGE